ncbi:TIGR03668 family PPOX class F420-dependent oxidoreductase [Streptomyces botrytidirepellens]|uniref:TIGR03668 family PPOX class F420-dependent oxidoreductase n=1 Tax=Streptomyces botrytidirepellens TaxID=2486417 RepID=A0A3M8VXN1_9ACTN|nr:TIGR03668 family PPOX class F420-dependent oxidoreductase [Streptomyces botrytidirepellens]RNG20393.1 TIGR03668 family PPOX class F420-dependent oxidoreductase [Streptomyces botrytidirepellens]
MRLETLEARRRFARARVLRLATTDEGGRPHLVPATFALTAPDGADGVDTVVTAVDHKPKRHQDLKRLRNIHTNPAVSLLVDHYDEDWRQLWWVRADGRARIVPADAAAERADPVRRLVDKYPQYADRPPRGPVIAIEVTRWSGWAFTEEQPDR